MKGARWHTLKFGFSVWIGGLMRHVSLLLLAMLLASMLAACGQAAATPTAPPAPTGLTEQEQDAITGMIKPADTCVQVVEELDLPDGTYVKQGTLFEKRISLRLVTPVTGKLIRFYRAIINGEFVDRPSWVPEVLNFPGSQQAPAFAITPQLIAPRDFEGRAILFYAFGDAEGNFCGQPIKVAAVVIGK